MSQRSHGETGLPLRDPIILAMAHLDAGPALLGRWSEADTAVLREAAAPVLSQIRHAAQVVSGDAERLVAGIALVPFLEQGGAFGPAWPAHPLASSVFGVSYRLREPDITRALKSLMDWGAGRRGAERARSFLRILLDMAGATEVAATLQAATRPNVAAEHSIDQSGRKGPSTAPGMSGRSARPRIDLLFDWPIDDRGRHAVVVVEAKLGADVSDGQLRPYREEARRCAKGGPVALILLTAWSDPVERRHRAWRPVRWFGLLRRWEAALAETGDTDPEFTRVRAELWRFMFSQRGALS